MRRPLTGDRKRANRGYRAPLPGPLVHLVEVAGHDFPCARMFAVVAAQSGGRVVAGRQAAKPTQPQMAAR